MGYSKQREAMLTVLRNTKIHPTANDIYEKMRESDPKISRGTVYRNLALLSERGTVLRIDTVHNSVHYDGDTKPHYHFVCNGCGAVYDLSVGQIRIDAEVEKDIDCQVESHSLIFYGECKECRKQK